ncbi:MAG: FAD-binding oxidoreductase, partial [Pseudomonadota bacterium]
MSRAWDVVVVGAGSVGTPIALYLARAGLSVAVLDGRASVGRGDNRAAIGGIRATHSEPAKIALGLASLEAFSGWRAQTGHDIGWRQGGYTFVAYTEAIAAMLQALVARQRAVGLDITWHQGAFIRALVPGIAPEGLLGGTFSPGDGSASPLLYAHSFRVEAERAGARFFFHEPVVALVRAGERVVGVRTPKGDYPAGVVVNAAGADAAALGSLAGLDLPVVPDSHEGGISEPVARFLEPMVVDIRPGPGSKNFYFYQNAEGQVVFCITPDPLVPGTDRRHTSEFLPMVAKRMVALLPQLAHLKVRRVWRGTYPMSPDGSPLLGYCNEVQGFFLAAGMCGQGFMLGPGIGALIARVVAGRPTIPDLDVLDQLRPA